MQFNTLDPQKYLLVLAITSNRSNPHILITAQSHSSKESVENIKPKIVADF